MPKTTPAARLAEIIRTVHYLSVAMAKLGVDTRHAAAHHAWQQG